MRHAGAGRNRNTLAFAHGLPLQSRNDIVVLALSRKRDVVDSEIPCLAERYAADADATISCRAGLSACQLSMIRAAEQVEGDMGHTLGLRSKKEAVALQRHILQTTF